MGDPEPSTPIPLVSPPEFGQYTEKLSVGWVDPWVGVGRDFSVFGGLGWVHYTKSTKNLKGLC